MRDQRQRNGESSSQMPKPRICMPTARRFKKRAFQCGHYEAQDILHEVDNVDLIYLERGPGYELRENWQRKLLYRDVSRRLIFQNPGLRKVRLTQEYDLFIALCQNYHDFLSINAIQGWKDHCKTSVVWIDEMWAAAIPDFKYWLHALNRFDHVLIGTIGTEQPLSDAIGRKCEWLAGGVDALRFTPFPHAPARVIDVYSVGRRWDGIHQALLKAAENRSIFYIADTFSGSYAEVFDHRQHRELYANMAIRSKYFMVAPGKVDAPEETQGQVGIGYRYYEGAAAGAVMIGQPPNCEAFTKMFPWDDAVVEIDPSGSDVVDVLSKLDAEPERLSAIGKKNGIECLLRHDWAYRWKDLLRIAGMQPLIGMEKRIHRLADVAEEASNRRDENKFTRLVR
jgi:hypothetical protein